MGDNGRKDDDPLSSYWSFRSWLPDDRHERGYENKPRPAPAAERALKNVENEFRNFSLDEFGEVFSKLLDEIREKWTRKDDDGAWPTQRRLWETYESVLTTGDDEEIGNRLGKVLAYLKKHYRSRLIDHGKRRSRFIDHVIKGDPDDDTDEERSRFDGVEAKVDDPETATMMADLFNRFRVFVRGNYKGARIDELIAVINAIENGAWKRRDIAAEAGIDVTRLATIIRTLRDLGEKWRQQDADAAPLVELLDQLDDEDTEPLDQLDDKDTEPLDQLDDEDTEPPTDEEDPQ